MNPETDPISNVIASIAANYGDPDGEIARATMLSLSYRQRHSGKTCSTCRLSRPLAAFGSDSTKPDGLAGRCKSCEAARKRAARNVPHSRRSTHS